MDRLLLALLGLAAAVCADPDYYVAVNNGFPTHGGPGVSTQGAGGSNVGGVLAGWTWNAAANQGHLGAYVSVSQSQAPFTYLASFAAKAGFEYDDVVFSWTGAGPAPTEAFNATVQFKLSGTWGGNSDTFHAPGVVGTVNTSFGSDSLGAPPIGFMPDLSSPFDEIITIQYTGVRYNTPYMLSASLSATATVAGNGTAFSDVGQSFHLVTDRPVFIVPDGTTVNSAQAGIVDNRYALPFAQAPEPVALPLVALACLALLRRRRRIAPD